jgi:hypothetical protein
MKGTQMLDLLNVAAKFGTTLHGAPLTADEGDSIIPDTNPALPPGVSGDVGILLGWLQGVGWVLCVAGLIIGAIMFGIARRRGDSSQEAISGLALPCGAAIVIGAASAIIGTFAG